MATEKEARSVEEEWGTSVKERFMAEKNGENSSLILAAKRTKRKDPTDNFNLYTGGWNISNTHYWTVSLSLFYLFISVVLSCKLALD